MMFPFRRKQAEAVSDSRVYADLNELVALRSQATKFTLHPPQPKRSVLWGRHHSRLRGRGLDFEELRHYRPGDDIRLFDWRVSRRTGKPHVRVYSEEKERPVLLLIDQRTSMFFGSEYKMKSVVAAEIAALLGWGVMGGGDRVGALVFDDQQLVALKPQRHSRGMLEILQATIRMNHRLEAGISPPAADDQLAKALSEAQRLCGHDYMVVLIGDLSGWNNACEHHIKHLSRHNDLLICQVTDPLETELPRQRTLVVSDGQLQIEVNTHHDSLQQRFSYHYQQEVASVQREVRPYGVPLTNISSAQPVVEQLLQSFGEQHPQVNA